MGSHMNILMGSKIQYLCSMNYKASVEYLYTKLPMFSKTGVAALKMDLNNTIAICSHLNNPHKSFKSIHVAGTNGKGSVSHMIASILQEQGYKTGLYTSPHLEDFRERIKVNGEMISEEAVVDFTKRITPLIEEIGPSFFEVTVGMAFEYFAQQEVDFAVIETGLGGRLDSTNIIHPIISVITNISYDHVQILGNTLDKIASEKAGIIKANTPVVIGKTQLETQTIFEQKALDQNASICFADQIWSSNIIEAHPTTLSIQLSRTNQSEQFTYHSPLAGSYQQENIITVRVTIDLLRELNFNVNEQSIQNGIKNVILNTGLHGRWETISTSPLIILDVAHNSDGVKKMLEQLKRFNFKNLYLVVGISADKDVNKVLSLLPKHAHYAFTKAHLPRAMDPFQLKEMAFKHELNGECFENVNDAIEQFKAQATKEDLILVCGSIFVVGEVDRKRFISN
jgi:dihydrofolate synthase/folylpolyglutamate synthase